MSAKASCTWGDGPDVMVIIANENVTGFGLSAHNGAAGSFGLTAEEARRLAAELIESADMAEKYDVEIRALSEKEP